MTILSVAMFAVLAQQPAPPQQLPSELRASQVAGPRPNAGAAIAAVAGQAGPEVNPPQIPATQLEERQTQAGGRMRVQFRDIELRALLSALAQNEGLNLSIDPTITEMVTIDLDNVTLQEALDAILTPRQLQYQIDGNLLRVTKLQMRSRTFSFDYITTARTLGRSLSANANAGISGGSAGAGGGIQGGSSTSLNGTETTNLLADVETALNSLKSATGKFIFNRMSGLIFATDFPMNLDAIGLFLETIQNSVNRQVVIEAKFIEVQLNNNSQTGVNWNAVLGNVTLTQDLGTAGAFRLGVTNSDFNLLFSLLSSQGKVNVLSNPTVATMNNQPAVVRVGTQDVFFTTTTQVDPRTGTIIQTATIPSTINEGVVLDVTPSISDDGIIMMNIHPTITERTGQAVSPRGDSVPIVDVRETDTVVRVREGDTIIIAGLISNRQLEQTSKLPLLGDIPFLGNIFKRQSTEERKTDLLILLTPRIMTIRTAVDYTKNRIEAQEQLKQENNQPD